VAYFLGLLITNGIFFGITKAITHSHSAAVAVCVVWTIVSILGFISYHADRRY